jgi:transcriptional regulator GlxA family with amidase domain
MTEPINVGILIFDEVEVLDFCGPFEVFSSALAGGGSNREERRLFKALIVAEEDRLIACRGNLLVQPHFTLTNHPPLGITVIPGGFGTRQQRTNPVVLDWIAAQSQTALTTSVCTGAFLLAANGLLAGKRATTHWASIDWMRANHPEVETVDDQRVVDQGRIITSAGVSAGIDMALYVIERLHGRAIAAATARDMEYDWRGGTGD